MSSFRFDSLRVGRWRAWFGRSCLFKRGIEDFNIALGAQVAEPIVEENVDLLLEQNLLDARGDFFEGWSFFAFGVKRQQGVVVVGSDLLVGDTDALAETELNEAENLQEKLTRWGMPIRAVGCVSPQFLKAFFPSHFLRVVYSQDKC